MRYLYETLDHPNQHTTVEVVLPAHNFETVDFRDMGLIDEPEKLIPRFIEGERYSLRGVACDGFKMKEKVYELIGMVDSFKGTEVNSVIVKQVEGEIGKIFTLSKNDCLSLGIEYQSGLQLFPKNLPWELVKNEIEFDKSDLGTTPLSKIDNTIRYILLKFNGFKDYRDGYIITPDGKIIKEDAFLKSLRIETKEPIVYGNGVVLEDGKKLKASIVYPKGLLYNHGNFISSEDTIYVLIELKQKAVSLRRREDTIDGYFGVERPYLNGIDPNDFFIISWDGYGSKTIADYEAEKLQEKLEAEARVRREEQLRKEEEERVQREVERAQREVNRITKKLSKNRIEFEIPKFNPVSAFDIKSTVASVNMEVDSLDQYFRSLERSLDKMSKDLNNHLMNINWCY